MGITAPATFNGTVTFTATAATGGATVQVPITVNVTPAPTLVSTNCPGPTRAGGVTTGLPCVAPSGTTPANTVAFTALTGTVPPGGFKRLPVRGRVCHWRCRPECNGDAFLRLGVFQRYRLRPNVELG